MAKPAKRFIPGHKGHVTAARKGSPIPIPGRAGPPRRCIFKACMTTQQRSVQNRQATLLAEPITIADREGRLRRAASAAVRRERRRL